MRYALRNQHKIAKAYSNQVLKRITRSLDAYFKKQRADFGEDAKRIDGDKYDTLIINDIDHSTNLIAFYIIEQKYDVYRLAFKEFFG